MQAQSKPCEPFLAALKHKYYQRESRGHRRNQRLKPNRPEGSLLMMNALLSIDEGGNRAEVKRKCSYHYTGSMQRRDAFDGSLDESQLARIELLGVQKLPMSLK